MLESIARPLASYWASTFPDAAPLVAKAAGAARTPPLWEGPVLAGSDLVDGLMSVLAWATPLALLFAALTLFNIYAVWRSRKGNPIKISGFFPVLAPLFAGGALILATATTYAFVDQRSGQAVAIARDAVYLASESEVRTIQPEGIRSISICTDCRSVIFSLKDDTTLTVVTESGGFETLRSAANAIMVR